MISMQRLIKCVKATPPSLERRSCHSTPIGYTETSWSYGPSRHWQSRKRPVVSVLFSLVC